MNLAAIDHLIAANLILLATDLLVAFAVSGLAVRGMVERNPSRGTVKVVVASGLVLWALSFGLATVWGWSPLGFIAGHPALLWQWFVK